jgi:hypothetical protein
MKEMFKELRNYAKEDPKDFVLSLIFLVFLVFILWASLWLKAICAGEV